MRAAVALELALTFLSVVFLTWLTEVVRQGDTMRFDRHVRAAVHSAAFPALTTAMLFITDLGSNQGLAILFAAALIVFWILRWRAAALLTLITMAGAAVLNDVLKLEVHRLRPFPFFGLTDPNSYSYASGHALLSVAFFSVIAWATASRMRLPSVRIVIWTVAVVIILSIGFSRIYLGVHYPTDVIAGYLTGIVWVTAVSLADRYYRHRKREAQ